MANDAVVVDVQSAWWSKINWAQAVGVIASILVIVSGGKIDLSPELQASTVLAIQALIGLITVIFKTFFTTTITPSSAKLIGDKNA